VKVTILVLDLVLLYGLLCVLLNMLAYIAWIEKRLEALDGVKPLKDFSFNVFKFIIPLFKDKDD